MTQTFATHRRLDPGYHYGALGLWFLAFGFAVRHVLHYHAGYSQFITLALLFILLLKVRAYALRVQDRVIRLEETLRMKVLLPADLQAELHRLTPAQFVALRFASDAELPARVAETLRENLGSDAIKQRIQTWRPDEFRV